MAAHSPLITIKGENHHQKLVSGLWDRFLCKKWVDLEVEWAGLAVCVHKLVLEVFLSPDKLNRRALLGWHWEEENQCLDALLEFLYRGQVTVRHDQLDNLLEAARESEFQFLVDALELKEREMGMTQGGISADLDQTPKVEVVSDPPVLDNDNNDQPFDNDADEELVAAVAAQQQQLQASPPPAKKRRPGRDPDTAPRWRLAEAVELTADILPPPRKQWTRRGDNPPEIFHCEVCEKTFKRNYHLNRHLLSHARLKLYTCNLCEKTYTDIGNLTRHQNNIHMRQKSQRGLKATEGEVVDAGELLLQQGEGVTIVAQGHSFVGDGQQFVEASTFDLTSLILEI